MLFLSFHAGSWESWCCCCLIPADRSWDRDRGRRWRLEMADTRSVHETRFEAAVKVIQSLPKNGSFQPTNEMMLKFYSFYKQATEGPCKLSRPGFWDPIGRYKWDAWSSLGDMTKEEAMIAYVEEMKKILETMPMTEKVEELLHVIGPFYEIVEDKKSSKSSDLTSVRLEKISKYLEDLGNVLTSTPNAKTVNGKAESSDSGAESEEEEAQEEVKGAEQSANDKKMMKKSADHKNLEIIVTNGYDKDASTQDIQNDIHASASLSGKNAEEIKAVDENSEQTGKTAVCIHQEINDDHVEDVSGIQHLTSDSDSEVYCDSMEQFGQEESLDSFTSNGRPFRYYLSGDPNQPLESPGFPEDVQGSPGNGNIGDMQVVAVEGKGEVKHGGEDGRSNSGAPHRERRGGENEEFSNVRRGRGHRMQHLSEGSKGRQVGSGGDGERWGSDRGSRGSLNEQIALVLMRLQEDMQNVLQRLHKLETLTASQAKSSTLQTSHQPPSQRPSWWPFEMSPGALTFAIVWPFIAQWLVHLYYQRRRRKLN
ncbi:acyl-CoA-binding domain-containing protein 5 [Panthera pardus]|uniref:Acyl-CoA-binding domain-containing protein 5 n=3 Tax=Panthera TaxID=9688 RepID=A0A8C8YAX9_PANLE|nr:acyl-CoA-binding domain-containing protein 5 isoform X1 [Panthera tigris]XP_019320830.2 acyl-CoA-binding domain-containing protein 5 [Panthera pardus]XP_042801106.1 acyl-CoA-binding domain-containing protein 5 isoform X1 [Panthera leo]XP_060515088.1 acyl-CoA-binding domain-containing protein 5 [Panthera onca]